MYLRRYRTATVQEALERARQELGPHALVLSTRLVPKPWLAGWLGAREVEVTAAVERPVSEDRPSEQPFRQPAAPDPSREAIVARLCAVGFDSAFAGEVAAAVPERGRRAASLVSLRRALAERLASLAAGDEPYAPVEVFVGPPGAGKTTTIAKIAAQERARRGRKLWMVAGDGYRVGAVEQLRLYADIIGSGFTVARSARELERAVGETRGPVLVDTAGRSPSEAASRAMFEVLAGRAGVRTHLVIAAGTNARGVDRIFESYQAAQPHRVVLTKLDEAGTLSPLVGVLRARRLPISYVGTGQRVPEDLERATPSLLAACVLGEGIAAGNPS